MRPLHSPPPYSSNPFMMSSSLYVMSNRDVISHSDSILVITRVIMHFDLLRIRRTDVSGHSGFRLHSPFVLYVNVAVLLKL